MRENIELFKENINLLKEQNEELLNKINNSTSSNSEKYKIESLFIGLKEDNERLVEELKKI
jgi:hypothetical protein